MIERIRHEWTDEEVKRLWPVFKRFAQLVKEAMEEDERDTVNLMELDLQMETDE